MAEQGGAELSAGLREALLAELPQFTVPNLREACGHLLGLGKLIRPRLQLAVYSSLSGRAPDAVLPYALAIELLHTFTLIHDDLPSMDDAALRRGRTTVHLAFGEANALLAGDALLNLALWDLVRPTGGGISDQQKLALTDCLCRATHAVIEGQVLDLEAEGQTLTTEKVENIHHLKTGALFAAACEMGAILADADMQVRTDLRELGFAIGALFQAQDDLLGFADAPELAGKSLGTDDAKEKATLPRLLGLEAARAHAKELQERVRSQVARLDLVDRTPLEQLLAELNSL